MGREMAEGKCAKESSRDEVLAGKPVSYDVAELIALALVVRFGLQWRGGMARRQASSGRFTEVHTVGFLTTSPTNTFTTSQTTEDNTESSLTSLIHLFTFFSCRLQ
jgi:hypothetical protein